MTPKNTGIAAASAALLFFGSLALEAGTIEPIEFSEIGIPYGWGVVMDENSVVETPADHVGAWSWDEDNFPATTRGWTHTSKWVKLDLQKPAQLTLKLENRDGVPWPSAEDATRLAGTNLFPSFSLYRGWDTDAGLIKLPDGTTLDQDHTFNNRGNIEWAEDVTYLDHVDNGAVHTISRTWILPAGQYTINLGGNSPAALAEGRQGYKATLSTELVVDQGIAIKRVVGGIQLRWPSNFIGWKLQSTSELNGGWSSSDSTPVRSEDGAYWEVLLTHGEGSKYFRLGN